MKNNSKSIFIVIILLLIVCNLSFSLKKKKDRKVKEKPKISYYSIETISFEEDSFLSLYDNNKNVIGYYKRFDNKTSEIKSAKYFDSNKKLLYTMIPVKRSKKGTLHIKDTNDKKSSLSLTVGSGFGGISFDTNTDFYDKPYSFGMAVDSGFGGVSLEFAVYYNDKKVMYWSTSMESAESDDIKIEVYDTELLNQNNTDTGFWLLSLILLSDIHSEMLKSFYM